MRAVRTARRSPRPPPDHTTTTRRTRSARPRRQPPTPSLVPVLPQPLRRAVTGRGCPNFYRQGAARPRQGAFAHRRPTSQKGWRCPAVMFECKRCGLPAPAQAPGHGRPRLFCSRECSIASRQVGKRFATCEDCTSSFPVGRRGPAPARCPACKSGQPQRRLTCSTCFAPFVASRKDQRYCSRRCREVQRLKGGCAEVDKPCTHCGVRMVAVHPLRQFCSAHCRTEACEARLSPAERTARWERRRARWQRRRASRQGASVGPAFTVRDVVARDGWQCSLCGGGIDQELRHPHPMSLSLDHVMPLSRGGEHSLANAAAAHLVCNVAKGNRLAVA